MKALVFGAGNIGRGFVGALFSQAGYEVCFVDVDVPLVEALNASRSYPIRIVANDNHEDILIENVRAVDGANLESVAREIVSTDIMATAVGAKALQDIVPGIAKGLHRRFKLNSSPLNIVICENLMDADKVLEELLREKLTEDEKERFESHVGLIESSIGRMVPIQTKTMKSGDALRICVERYGYLPVDKKAFCGAIPLIKGMIPFSPFDYYVKRKLYIHNMGHATCAYLGLFAHKEHIHEAIDDAEILVITQNAMLQSADALSKKYRVPYIDIKQHIDDLLQRFANAALADTCARVAADPARKLSNSDRLIGAALSCLEQGITPVYICLSIACAIYEYVDEQGITHKETQANRVLSDISKLPDDSVLRPIVTKYYKMFIEGVSLNLIRKSVFADQAETMPNII